VRRAVREHLRDFLALLFVFSLALVIAGVILTQQRFNPPSWVPLVGQDFYTIEGRFSTAQAVVPGQGQTVNIAGVKVGDVSSVELEDGAAVVEMDIEEKHAPIYRDATILLRPRTALKDMYLALDRGTPDTGELPEGGRIPISNTLPDVNPDEILAQLDHDVRDYLRILLNSAGEAFDDTPWSDPAASQAGAGSGEPSPAAVADLRETLKRFEPSARDTRAITAQLVERRHNVRRVIHNLRELFGELADNDRSLAAFVDSSNANFQAFARQDGRLREALRLFPGALGQSAGTLGRLENLARDMGPALQALRPGARALGPALRATRPFLRETTPIIRDQFRPFARDVQPTVRDLRPAARDLAVTTPALARSFGVVNKLLNLLAFNPGGSEEGFLFWTAWGNHNRATQYGAQDAHGPLRRGVVLVSCPTLQTLEAVTRDNPRLGALITMLNAPKREEVCTGPGGTAPTAGASR
jgi:phospholipid/cholesterol/gamma-HCH transport system substrate-binding protein